MLGSLTEWFKLFLAVVRLVAICWLAYMVFVMFKQACDDAKAIRIVVEQMANKSR